MLQRPTDSLQLRDAAAVEVVDDVHRGPEAEADVEEKLAGGGLHPCARAAESPGGVKEHADALVAGSGQPEPISFGSQTPIQLGERKPAIVEADERVQQPRRDPRGEGERAREREHASSVVVEVSHVCANPAPKPASDTVLQM